MVDGLAHLQLAQRRIIGAADSVQMQVADAHGVGVDDLDPAALFQTVGLVLRHAPDPVEAAAGQLDDLGVHLRDRALHDLLDLRLALRAVVIIGEGLEHQALAGIDLSDLVGAGADRLGAHALGPDFLIILLRIDADFAHIEQGQRVGILGGDPDLVVADLLRLIDPARIIAVQDAVIRPGEVIVGIDHIIGGHRIAVVELHTLANIDFDGLVIDDVPGGRQQRLELARGRIAPDQRVPHMMGDDDAVTRGVEIHVHIRHLDIPGDVEGVVGLSRHGRRCRQAKDHGGRASQGPKLCPRKPSHRYPASYCASVVKYRDFLKGYALLLMRPGALSCKA